MKIKTQAILRARQRSFDQSQILLEKCSELSVSTKAAYLELTFIDHKYNSAMSNINTKLYPEIVQRRRDNQQIKHSIWLHNILKDKIIESSQNGPFQNVRAAKYIRKEETLYDRNPVLYLKQQCQALRLKNARLNRQTKQFVIQQQKFVETFENYRNGM